MNLSTFIWDYLIISYLTASAVLFYLLYKSSARIWPKLNFKQKISRILLGLFFIIFFSVIFYGSFVAPKIISIEQININLGTTQTAESIKIVQISDLHASFYKGEKFFGKAAEKVKRINPDLIVFTGDFFDINEKDVQKLRPFQTVTQIYPSYAITGNHEYGMSRSTDELIDKTQLLRQFLKKLNIQLIDNQIKLINNNNSPFYLAGIKDIWAQDNNELILQQLNDKAKNGWPKILLAHNPDTILFEEARYFNLILSGHTHGGQICLPLIGPIPSVPTQLGRKFASGLFKFQNTYLYISKGLGESGPRARLFCRPQITVINLDL